MTYKVEVGAELFCVPDHIAQANMPGLQRWDNLTCLDIRMALRPDVRDWFDALDLEPRHNCVVDVHCVLRAGKIVTHIGKAADRRFHFTFSNEEAASTFQAAFGGAAQ